MTYRFFFVFILSFLGVIMILTLSSPQKDRQFFSKNTSFPRPLQDALGKTLLIPVPPQHIVSQTLATDEILLAICPPKRIAALSPLAFDDRYSNLTDHGNFPIAHHVEQILRLKPDLIFVASYSRAETVELLQATGAPVFRFAHFQNLEAIKNNIRTVGYAIGEDIRAEHLVMQMEQDLQAIRKHLPQSHSPPRIISYSVGNYTAGAHTLFDDMVKFLGAINIVSEQGIEGHVQISDEQILMWHPDFIITHAHLREFAQMRHQLLENPAIATSLAGKEERIIVIEHRHFLSVSHYIVLGIKALAESLYSRSTLN